MSFNVVLKEAQLPPSGTMLKIALYAQAYRPSYLEIFSSTRTTLPQMRSLVSSSYWFLGHTKGRHLSCTLS